MNQNNGERRDYQLGNRITGFARPAAKKYTPTLAKRQHILSDADGRWSSVFTVAIKPATQVHTSPALNIQMSNGNGSAFQRVNGPEELRAFAHSLAIWADELETVWQTATQEGKYIEQAQQDVQQKADMFREMMNQFGGEQDSEPEQPPVEIYHD